MVDFIEEVDERVRSDRYAALARRYLPWFAAAIAATIVGWLGVWAYDTWQDRDIAQASQTYQQGIEALSQGNQARAFTLLDTLGRKGPAGYRTLALINLGNMRLNANKPAEAVSYYDAAAKVAPNHQLGDLASLRAAQTLMDTAPLAQIQARLTPLIGEKKPFDMNAREALALAKLQAGKTVEARGDFNALTLKLGVTQEISARAAAAIAIIDAGEAGAVAQVVKRAATMPPPDPNSLRALTGVPSATAGASSAPETTDGTAQ